VSYIGSIPPWSWTLVSIFREMFRSLRLEESFCKEQTTLWSWVLNYFKETTSSWSWALKSSDKETFLLCFLMVSHRDAILFSWCFHRKTSSSLRAYMINNIKIPCIEIYMVGLHCLVRCREYEASKKKSPSRKKPTYIISIFKWKKF